MLIPFVLINFKVFIKTNIHNESTFNPDKLIEVCLESIDSMDYNTRNHFLLNKSEFFIYNAYIQPKTSIIKNYLNKEDYFIYINSKKYGKPIIDSLEIEKNLRFDNQKNMVFVSPTVNDFFVVEIYQTKHFLSYNCAEINKGIRLFLLFKILENEYTLVDYYKKEQINECRIINNVD